MRDSWTETTLGEAVALIRDRLDPASCDPAEMLCHWSIPALDETGGPVTVPASQIGSHKFRVKKNAVAFSLLNPRLPRYVLIQGGENVVCSTEFAVMQPKSGMDESFLYVLASSSEFQKIVGTFASGTTKSRERVRPADLEKIQIRLPPLAVQKRIVNVTAAVDTYIAALQQRATDARAARNAVLHELLTAGGENWTETTLGKVAEIQQGQNLAIATLTTGDYPVYGANGIVGHFDKWNSDQEVVALGCRGSCGTVHFVTGKAWLANNVMAIWPKDVSKIVVSFIALVLETADLRSSGVISGQVQPQITRTSLSPLVIAVPSLSDQEEIVEIVSAMDDVIRSTEQAISEAQKLRSGLLSDLLSGDHEIPETYDHLLGAA